MAATVRQVNIGWILRAAALTFLAFAVSYVAASLVSELFT